MKLVIKSTFLIFNIIICQNTLGLIINSSSSYSGFTLFAPNHSTNTYLINNEGLLVNEWSSSYVPGLAVYLLENGNLLRSAAIESDNTTQTGGFELFTWDNILIWQYYQGSQHHDIEPLPNGNVLMIVNDVKNYSAAISAGRDPEKLLSNSLRSLSILEISQIGIDSGEIVWEWHAWDHLIQDFDETKLNYGSVDLHPELIDVNFAPNIYSDWLHTNSIDYNEDLDQILVSHRNTNEIWVIDHSTTSQEASGHTGGISGKGGDILFRWGNPVSYRAGEEQDQRLFGQHDANWVRDEFNNYQNSIMIFNNGIERPSGSYSTAIEISVPLIENNCYNILETGVFGPADEVWSYTSPDTFDFSSPRFGSAQRLQNGNTLISNSEMGTFFEVDSLNENVWKYINPVSTDGILFQGDSARNNTVFRCYRYGQNYAGFDSVDTEPLGPIEFYLNINNDLNYSKRLSFSLNNNYPNPFNPKTWLSYYLPKETYVRLSIYNMQGELVKILINDIQPQGLNIIDWDATNSKGNKVGSGIYIYNIRTSDYQESKRLVFIK